MRKYWGSAVAVMTMLLFLISWNLSAQVVSPVKWTFGQKKISDKEIELIFNDDFGADFTGHGCVNCREMDANVWSDPLVLERLNRDFIIIFDQNERLLVNPTARDPDHFIDFPDRALAAFKEGKK